MSKGPSIGLRWEMQCKSVRLFRERTPRTCAGLSVWQGRHPAKCLPRMASTRNLRKCALPTQQISSRWVATFDAKRARCASVPTAWPTNFWEEVYEKFPSAPAPPEHQYVTDNSPATTYQLLTCVGLLYEHFRATRQGSDDRVHETAFALVFSATALVYEVIEFTAQTRFSGLAALRTVTECAINMAFLTSKSDPDLWHRFRAYGSGQAHLISTKLESSLASANCVDPLWISAFLHEEHAKMFTDIQLGDWTGENIRSRAEQGSTKDLYDSYYDYCSSLLHGDWLGAATFGTTWDLNPFHRLQCVPRRYPRNFPSVMPDLFRVMNRILDSLVTMYPGFDFRLPALELSRADGSVHERTPEAE